MRVIAALSSLLLCAFGAFAQSTGFTYQGRLDDGGLPANGVYDVRFTMYGVEVGGSPISSVVCAEDVPVINGLFSVIVPLTAPTVGDAFLEVQVRAGAAGTCATTTGYTTMTPRQSLTPAPKAVYAHAVPAQSPTLPGALRFNAAAQQFEGFNGTWWVPLTAGAPLDPQNSQTFTAPGFHDFVVPAGITRLGADLWAGGGAGGNRGSGATATSCSTSGAVSGGGGGGSSGTYTRAMLDVTPGETLRLYVGPGGIPTSTNGGNGENTSISRGVVIVVRSYGGRGGSVGVSYPSLQTSSSTCPQPPSGAGGAAPASGQIFGSGSILSTAPGLAGGDAVGPGCRSNFPNPGTFCSGFSGSGGAPRTSAAPLPVVYAGAGGTGLPTAFGDQQAGYPGMIRLFWD